MPGFALVYPKAIRSSTDPFTRVLFGSLLPLPSKLLHFVVVYIMGLSVRAIFVFPFTRVRAFVDDLIISPCPLNSTSASSIS
jgi:hypothetical protein